MVSKVFNVLLGDFVASQEGFKGSEFFVFPAGKTKNSLPLAPYSELAQRARNCFVPNYDS
jgi:hypothetical protein